MPGLSYLVDTNILLRLVQPDSPAYGTIRECTDRLWARPVWHILRHTYAG
jgi:hypothetical protein